MAIVKVSKTFGYMALAGASLVPVGAGAQVLTNPIPVLPSDYPTERTGVADRDRPDYQSEGIPFGSLNVHPVLSVGVEHSSNVYGSTTGKVQDFRANIAPSIVVEGTGGSLGTGSVLLKVDGALRRYADEKFANETGFGGLFEGTVPLGGDNYLMGGAAAKRTYERQESGSFPTGSLAPIRYRDITAFLRVRGGGSRIRATAAIDVTQDRFSDAKLSLAGATLDQSFRDRTVIRGSGKLESSFTGAASGFVEGRYSVINYRNDFVTPTLPNRDGKQAEGLAGVRIDSGKLRGVVAAGYTYRTFDTALLKDFGGIAVNAEMTYYASGLSTFTLTGYRNIAESGDPTISAQFSTGASARVDHELLRYIILSGVVSYDVNTYRNANRKDEVATVRGGVRYLASRRIELDADVRYVKRTSNATFGPEFNRFEFGVSLVGRL